MIKDVIISAIPAFFQPCQASQEKETLKDLGKRSDENLGSKHSQSMTEPTCNQKPAKKTSKPMKASILKGLSILMLICGFGFKIGDRCG